MIEELIEQKAEEYVYEKLRLLDKNGEQFRYAKKVWLNGYHECQKEHEWHDLHEDKNDLPKEEKQYLCCVLSWVGGEKVYACLIYDTQYHSWKESYGDVIKWKEIV